MKPFATFRTLFVAVLVVIGLVSFILLKLKRHELQQGTWRAALKTASGAEIPFIFEAENTGSGRTMTIINGNERFVVNNIRLKGDSVIIRMPLFDSDIRAVFDGKSLRGEWIKHLATRDVPMEFSAAPGVGERFKLSDPPASSVGGRWSAVFSDVPGENGDTTVAEFKQNGSRVTGTFLTTTGDYRFLEGGVSGNKLMLSCFDGSHAFLFTAAIENDRTLSGGKFYSGYSSLSSWSARKDDKAALPDAYSLTALKPGYKTISFSFPDLERKTVSLSDPKFKGKVTVIQFMGSWCPNCMDETAYLASFFKKYHPKGVEVIGLAYERFTDYERARKNVLQLKERFKIPYDLLITGSLADKAEVAKSIPALNNFLAFPTTILLNKKGEVSRIHTGFSGPGTGNYYTEFISEFERSVNDLLAEK